MTTETAAAARARAAAEVSDAAAAVAAAKAEVERTMEVLRIALLAAKDERLTPAELTAAVEPHVSVATMYRLIAKTDPGPKRTRPSKADKK